MTEDARAGSDDESSLTGFSFAALLDPDGSQAPPVVDAHPVPALDPRPAPIPVAPPPTAPAFAAPPPLASPPPAPAASYSPPAPPGYAPRTAPPVLPSLAPPVAPPPSPPPPPSAWGDALDVWAPAPVAWSPPAAKRRPNTKHLVISGTAVLLAIVAVAAIVLKPWQSPYPSKWDDRVSAIALDVEGKRGLEFKHPVAVHFMSDADFEATLSADDVSAEDQAAIDQGTAELRALGLVGAGVDVYGAYGDARQSGTLAYYDTETEEIYVRGDVMDAAHRVTVAHELTHVLQDQNFDLQALDERAATSESGDYSALRALVEGDATRIEDEYIARLSEADKAEYDAEMAAERERFGGDTTEVPEILLFQLGAPYTYGPYTVRVLLANGGNEAVDAALTGPTPSARMFLEPAELEAGTAAEPIVPQGSEALGPPMNFTPFDVYVMLAARADAYAALRAADEVTGGKYVTYQAAGGPYCVQASLATRSVAGRATLVAALNGWAATMPGAVVADVGDAVRVTSCDPGPQSTAPDDAQIQRSEQLLALRGELAAGLAENDLAPETARCAARLVASRADLYDIFFLDVLTPEQQQALGEAAAFSTSACQANPAAGLSG